jgi:hypothetical protein
MSYGREQRLNVSVKWNSELWNCCRGNFNVNVLQRVCTLAVNCVVRDVTVPVTRTVAIFLVDVLSQVLPVSGKASHSFCIAYFSSIC